MNEQLIPIVDSLAFLLLVVLLVGIIVFEAILLVHFIIYLLKHGWKFMGPKCILTTKVSVKGSRDESYHNNFDKRFSGETVYLKYEITAIPNNWVSHLVPQEIPFTLEVQPLCGIKITLHECSNACFSPVNEGLIITSKTKFTMYVLPCKKHTTKIVLRCERTSSTKDNNLFYFKISPNEKELKNLYSEMVALKFYSY